MTTLFDLTYQVAKVLNTISEGTATGGAAGPPVTLIDTNGLQEADDYWNGSTCWVLYDTGGLGAAPQNQFSVVADYTLTSHTLTMRVTPEPVFTAAPASGDRYALGRKRYPLDRLITYINAALADLGTIPYTNVSLVTANDQTEYGLPSALMNYDLREVWLETNKDSDDHQWQLIHNWRCEPAPISSAKTLIVPQFDDGYTLMLVYTGYHPTLRINTDALSELVHPDLVIFPAALKCLMWYKAKTEETGTHFNEQINYVQSEIDRAKRQFPLRLPPQRSKLFIVGNEGLPT